MATTSLESTTGADDTGFVYKRYGNVTISAGNTLTSLRRVKYMFLEIFGNLSVSGTITMTGKGAPIAVPANDFSVSGNAGIVMGGGDATLNLLHTIPKNGGTGGPGAGGAGGVGGSVGGSGGGASCYGGGGGGGGGGPYGGGGAGGAGGGGGAGSGTGGGAAGAPGANGAAGGSYAGGGGAPGCGGGHATLGGGSGANGCSGVLILLVHGNCTINSGGIISSDGANGGYGESGHYGGGGGGGGGGVIIIQCSGTYTNNGSVTVNGGSGGAKGGYDSASGANGASGTIKLL